MSDTKAVRLETGKEKKDIMISGFLGTRTMTFAPASIVINPRPDIIMSFFSLPVSSFDMSDTKAVRLETGKEKKDIMISGLGFITIEAGDCILHK
jgi:urease beta subunit